jgi:hypothetical protein
MKILLLCIFGSVLLSGCTTPKYMRDRAATLEPSVRHYREQQQANLDRLNKEYRQTFGNLMEDLAHIARQDEAQWFSLDVEKDAELLAGDWQKLTTKRQFYDLFSRALVTDRDRIKTIEESVAKARDSYAKSYKEAAIELNKLTTIEQNLRQLSQKDKLSKKTLDEVKRLVEAIRKGLDEEAKNGKDGGA